MQPLCTVFGLVILFLLPAFLVYRLGKFLDQSHIRGIDCAKGPCDTCDRIAAERNIANWNTAIEDHLKGKPCKHPFTASRRIAYGRQLGGTSVARRDICLICDEIV